jgi:cobyric acid synthase
MFSDNTICCDSMVNIIVIRLIEKNLAYRYYYEQQNALDGVVELTKNLWLIIDNPKIKVKERMKAINLIMHCYYMRSKLLNSEAFSKEFLDYTKKVQSDEEALRIREQEITRKEKALQDYLDARKLTIGEFYNDPNKSDRVF